MPTDERNTTVRVHREAHGRMQTSRRTVGPHDNRLPHVALSVNNGLTTKAYNLQRLLNHYNPDYIRVERTQTSYQRVSVRQLHEGGQLSTDTALDASDTL